MLANAQCAARVSQWWKCLDFSHCGDGEKTSSLALLVPSVLPPFIVSTAGDRLVVGLSLRHVPFYQIDPFIDF